jgi:DNA-binding MarR family transcriptional regulator
MINKVLGGAITKKLPYNHRDRILWILNQKGGSITRTELRRSMEIKLENMERILSELEKEGRIKRTVGKQGELITLEG